MKIDIEAMNLIEEASIDMEKAETLLVSASDMFEMPQKTESTFSIMNTGMLHTMLDIIEDYVRETKRKIEALASSDNLIKGEK